ncbi:DUF3696 domain-containing protein [Plantactinospora solaniradicis]|uniref:DUF3696 domain-containing protein n=1 Tax=Plantactinospora solaniradicis TaxID=1723736 RepID=A0ABW1KFE7_9ACTN
MSLDRMALGNYRCFAQRQDIELRPVTVVLGRNNSGKSALVRAPVLLDSGIHTDAPTPLDLDRLGEGLVGLFVDLIHGRRAHGGIDIDLTVKPGPLRLRATVQNINRERYDSQVVSELELSQSGARLARFEWELNDPAEPPRYSVEVADQVWRNLAIPFHGLLPAESALSWRDTSLPGKVADTLLETVDAFRDYFPTVRYFGPFREQPQRRYLLPARMPKELGSTGLHTAGILASDTAGQQGELMRQVNSGLAGLLPGWKLDLVSRGEVWSVVLRSASGSDFAINLADAGTGVAQALPIFVQRAIDVGSPPDHPVLEIIEQPELHLHPAAHADLADLYLAAVDATLVRFLIETHSETFLLRLRRRIAEGLDPDTVAVYFVEQTEGSAQARRINIDSYGNLDYWPTGVFSEDYAETRALVRAQWEKRDASAR